MIIRSPSLALWAGLLSTLPATLCISPSEIPPDTPVSSLLSSAKANLANGNPGDALTYFDVAISRDPSNYLSIFQRGATYLSLGKNPQASQDFDKVLAIKPDFESALLQRARIKLKNADWEGAKADFIAAGKKGGRELAELEEAREAAILAADAAKKGDWEGCVGNAGPAIMTASTSLSLRQLRARCRFERGEIQEGVNDLAHVLQISPELIEPHLQVSSMLFYALGDTERGIAQLRKCLHSDPESKACSRLFRREKKLDKVLKEVKTLKEKHQFNSATKLLAPHGDSIGLLQEVRNDVEEAKKAGHIHKNAPNELYSSLVELACECYTEVRRHKAIYFTLINY